jgi:hypothetical protein
VSRDQSASLPHSARAPLRALTTSPHLRNPRDTFSRDDAPSPLAAASPASTAGCTLRAPEVVHRHREIGDQVLLVGVVHDDAAGEHFWLFRGCPACAGGHGNLRG